MILILSAQYVDDSLRAEVGHLPLSFLPLANKRLYVYQVEKLRQAFPSRSLFLTLPADFSLPKSELSWFSEQDVKLLPLNNVGNTGEELVEVLQIFGMHDMDITILHGGCLPMTVPSKIDIIGCFETDLEPELPVEVYGTTNDLVWAGLYSLSQPKVLLDCLNVENRDFYRAIKRYSFLKKLSNIIIESCYLFTNATCYFHARSSFTTERAFNRLKIDHNVLRKYSDNGEKIRAEAYWFDHLPTPLRKFIPQYLGDCVVDKAYFYSIEYLGTMPLNESFVFGRQTIVFWERIFRKISSFLTAARTNDIHACAIGARNEALFVKKAQNRLEDFIQNTKLDVDSELVFNGVNLPSLRHILEDASSHLMNLKDVPALVHGDLCLSNILYDSRMRAIKLIDPRGIDENGDIMMYGSQLYDVAKLAHSILGLYDHIVAGQYSLSIDGQQFWFKVFSTNEVEEIQCVFRRQNFLPGVSMSAIERTLPVLFIAMLPLHADSVNRQTALLANAMRLYSEDYNNKLY